MKKKLPLLLFLSVLHFLVFCQAATHREVLIGGQSTVQYLQGPASITYSVQITVEYNGTTQAADIPVNFVVQNLSNAALAPVINNLPQNIPHVNYTLAPNRIVCTLNISIATTAALTNNESFDIQLTGAAGAGDPKHHVIIQNNSGSASTPAQVSIKHLTDTVEINPLIKDEAATARKSYKLKFQVNGILAKDSAVKLKLETISGNSVNATLVTKEFKIDHNKTIPGSYTDSVIVYFDVNSVKNFGDKDEQFFIAFEAETSFDEIIITRRGFSTPNKSFWVEVGSNFDFIDGLEPNNFFAGVFVHKRDIRPFNFRSNTLNPQSLIKRSIKRANSTSTGIETYDTVLSRNSYPARNNIAIFGGVYESKTISTLSENRIQRVYYDPLTAPIINGDTVGIFKDTGIVKNIQVTRNISLFFSPQIRLTNRSANEDGLHIFVSLWTELQWQKLTIETDYSGLKRLDTSIRLPKSEAASYLPQNNKTAIDIKSHYAGIGIPFYFRDNDVNFYANPVFGWSTQPKEKELKPFFEDQTKSPSTLERVWRPFYVFQFRLNEERYGLAFTGEVRGLIMKNSPPVVSIALSKKFDLTKFMEFK